MDKAVMSARMQKWAGIIQEAATCVNFASKTPLARDLSCRPHFQERKRQKCMREK